VGFNLDIAHMRIAGISARKFECMKDRVVHAHISDHPGMHTHDQIVGSWTNPGAKKGGYSDYVRLLADRNRSYTQLLNTHPPFSEAIAIELEGCNRIFWIHDSITRLRHAILANND
jgi:sugar phosphate isomerase/epimerase